MSATAREGLQAIDLAQRENTYSNIERNKVLNWQDAKGVAPVKALQDGDFVPLTQRKFSLNIKKHWYLLKVNNPEDRLIKRYIATGLPSTPRLRMYSIEQDSVQQILFDVSASDNFFDRPIRQPLLFMPIELPPNSEVILLIEHQSLANYPLSLRFLDKDGFYRHTAFFNFIRGVVLGALLIYLVFFTIKACATPTYGAWFYCGYLTSFILLVGQIFGYQFAFFWPAYGAWNHIFTSVIIGVSYGFYFLFSATLFPLKKLKPKLYYLAVTMAVVAFILAFWGGWQNNFIWMVGVALVALPIPVAVGIWACRQRLLSARLFLAGTLAHCTLSYLLAMACLGVDFGISHYLFSFLSVGQIAELTLFSLVVLFQTRQLKDALTEQLQQRLKDTESLVNAEKERAAALQASQQSAINMAAVGHDMTQPLAAIRLAIALVDDDKSSQIKQHIINTLNYTDDLLKSMTTSGANEYRNVVMVLSAEGFLGDLVERHQAIFTEKGLFLRVRTSVKSISCMPILLHRLLDNLITNACRYTDSGGALISIRSRSGIICVDVWDTGRGMPTHKLQDLQKPFEQGDSLHSDGVGLGLYIARCLAEQAGYQLSFSSQVAKGSRVSLRLNNA